MVHRGAKSWENISNKMGPSAVSEEHSGALSVQPQVSKVFFRSPTSKLYSSALFFLCS
jgi:hypothetical protein